MLVLFHPGRGSQSRVSNHNEIESAADTHTCVHTKLLFSMHASMHASRHACMMHVAVSQTPLAKFGVTSSSGWASGTRGLVLGRSW